MSDTNLREENKLLEQQKSGALRELEKVTGQLFKAQDQNKVLTEIIEEKKHTEQMGAWAIDRALETAKMNPSNPPTPESVIDCAAKFAEWIMSSSAKKLEAPSTETMQ